MQGQCFDCAKNIGGWNGDVATDLKKTSDGLYLAKNSGNFGDYAGLYKYDFNCNLVWKKEIDNFRIQISKLTYDSQGNIYVLITWADAHNAVGPFPISFNGFPMYPGLNLFKFDKNGNLIWNRSIGHGADYGMRDIYIYNDILYITGTFYTDITINNQIKLINTVYTGNYVYHALLFIATFDLNGNLKDAQKFGTSNDDYISSEMDKKGNLYFSRSDYNNSSIDKIDSSLNIVWTKEISNNKIKNESYFIPTLLRYNSNNDKLYLWGSFYKFADILGTIYTDPNTGFNITQSILSEFNVITGKLERIKQINNSSTLAFGPSAGNTAYLAEKDNELFIFSSFTGVMKFPNKIIESRTFNGGGNTYYYSEELVLFKVNLNSFDSEFILKSSGTSYYTSSMSTDAANPILFHGNDLYLTASFQSSPLIINNTVINNNSGNNASDVMLYKYKLDASSTDSGAILAENTCFNEPTNFEVKGNFDSILWDFDDSNSTTNNSATISNPKHQFTAIGTYNVSAIIKCGTETQTLKKEIVITNIPKSFTLDPITACETTSGTGISNSFDTSNINEKIIDNQTNLVVEYRDSNGNLLQTPLPNPYTNTVKNEETIKVKSYFANNPSCFAEADLKLQTITKPANLLINSPQNFCIQQNATLNNIAITGQNIKWYDAAAAGTLLPNTTLLQNNTTYYASQSINGCESERVPVKINIQNTPPPTGDANQPFCSGSNPTIASIMVTGDLVKWYDTASNGTLLPTTTNLQDGKTYYVSQTVNNCESQRFAVTVSVKDTPLAPLELNSRAFCKSENATLNDIQIDGQNLKWYSSNIAASTLPNTTLLENNTTYYVSQTTGCESERTPILVKVNDTNLPTAKTEQPFCIDQNATIADINIQGTGIIWYDEAIAGNILTETTLLENKTYYATQTVNTCESKRVAVSIKIQDTPNPIANSPQTFCIQKNAKISDIEINGENIKWFESLSSNTTLSEITLLQNGITYYASQTINNCESDRIPVTIKILEATTGDCINFVDELPFPKFFTPNNDTYNDYWTIDFAYLAPNTGIKIFDRYGKLIKELVSNGTWDGTFLGQELPASDYWFSVTRLNGTEYRGHFSLKR